MAFSKSTRRGTTTREQLAKFEIKVIEGLAGGESTGSGSFGAVYKVNANGVPRIAKRLHSILLTPDIRPQDKAGIREKFCDECLLLSKLDHPCIVQFVGVHFHGSDVTLVMERLHTDLERFLDPEQRLNIPLSIKLSFLLNVSSGLLYLHTQLEQPLIHRDLKPENILITKDLRAKIADLGVSKLLKNYPRSAAIHTKCPGTLAYMPPEALSEDPRYDAFLDIFSYGQLTLYTVIQMFPEVYSGFGNPRITSAFRVGESEILRRQKWIDRLSQDHCLRGVILQCLKDRPEERPTTRQLNNTMRTLCVKNPRSLDDIVSVWEEKEAKAELTAKCDAKELLCKQLKQENQILHQKLNKCRCQVDTMKEQAAVMTKALTMKSVEAKDLKEEKESLQTILEDIAGELERRKIEAQAYKEDFENERKDRTELADKYDSEKAKMSLEYHDLKAQVEKLEKLIELKQTLMQQERVMFEKEIQHLKQELSKVQKQNVRDNDSLQIAFTEKQSLASALPKLNDKYQEKEAHLERALAQKSDLEEKLKKAREDHEHQVNELRLQIQQLTEQLPARQTELQQQIAKANVTLSGDCQAKTEQVKQYKKQVDAFRAQVDSLLAEVRDSRAKIVEYEGQLEYYQEQVRQLNEDDEQKAAMMKAQCEADILNMSRDLEKLKREKVMWETTQKVGDQRGPATTCDEQAVAHVQSLSQQLEELKWSNHAMDIELHSQRNNYFKVTEKCEVYWRQIDTLLKALQQNGIAVPKLELPSAVIGRYPAAYSRGQDKQGQEGELHSLPADQYSYDGGPDKSMTSPAAIGPQANQQFEYNQQLVVPGSSPPMPHPGRAAGGIQRQQYQSGYARQGDGVVLGQQNRYQQGMQGQQVGGGVPRNPQHRMESTKMHSIAAGIGNQVNDTPVLASLSPQAPLDPNLICPMCRRQFRIGEIQKYRQHVKLCHGT